MDHGDGKENVHGTSDAYVGDEDPERSKWIHRDKLAEIESQELRQAGYQLPPQFRGLDPSTNGNRQLDTDEHVNFSDGDDSDQYHRGQVERRQRAVSTPESNDADSEEMPSFDLRTPEEIAADPYEEGHPSQSPRQPGLRASSSRIPLNKSSPLPIPQDVIERSTPLPRKRGYSGGWSGGDEDGLMYSKTRSRKNSMGSQVLLDDSEHINGTPTPASRPVSRSMAQPAPAQAKVPGKAVPVSGARKISAANRIASGPHSSRTSSNRHAPGQRPVTRSGDARPTSAINRPEGDPPWLATMYKPDPRLPPDQQLLPTHAKRLQQEQWEKEGKYGSSFDKEFSPIAVHAEDDQRRSYPPVEDPKAQSKEEQPSPWPLNTTPMSPTLNNSRPGTGGTDRGGYSTIPKVQKTPPPASMPSPKKGQQPSRMLELSKEEGRKEKGCGCCVVM